MQSFTRSVDNFNYIVQLYFTYANETYIYSFIYLSTKHFTNTNNALKEGFKNLQLKFVMNHFNLSILIYEKLLELHEKN